MNYNLLPLLPPLIVLGLGFITRRVLLSLLSGIICASLIATNGSILTSIRLIFDRFFANTELWRLSSWNAFTQSGNLFICLFIFILGILVTLLSYSGGAYAYARTVKKYIKNKKSAELSSLGLSSLFFIDDYFSSLTVGSVMSSITDSFRIPRVKLAFLVDAFAAPLAILCPASSWVAAIIGFLGENGIHTKITSETLIIADPLNVYIHILPFLFYSFTIMLSAYFIVIRTISFGPMQRHERIAQNTGNVFGNTSTAQNKLVFSPTPQNNHSHATIVDFIYPVLILLISVFTGLLFSGGYYLIGGNRSFISALQHAQAAKALFFGGFIALLLITVFFLLRKKIPYTMLLSLYWNGILLMIPAILTLLFSWTLGDILRDSLHTGTLLASIAHTLSVKSWALPALFFIFSVLTSIAIGSSWGTIALLIPIALPMLLSLESIIILPVPIEQVRFLFPLLGAIFSGAVAGDHISPISDTTIMASTSTGSSHIEHVYTQLWYACPAIIGSISSFLLAGILIEYNWNAVALLSVIPGIVLTLCVLQLLQKYAHN